MANLTWCRLHSDIRSNWKVASLSHRDRWVYICHLTFMTDGSLEGGAPDKWLASQCGLQLGEFHEARSNLIAARLLNSDGLVKNFAERQYKDHRSAKRSERYRGRKEAERDASRDEGRDESRVTYYRPETEQNRCSVSEAREPALVCVDGLSRAVGAPSNGGAS